MTNQQLLREWQKRLGLSEWKIVLHDDCTPMDLQNASRIGENEFTTVCRCSNIRIIKPECYPRGSMRRFDFEEVLVHELLHINFAFIMDNGNSLQDRLVHQLIDDMARALVDAKRAGNAAGIRHAATLAAETEARLKEILEVE